MSDDQIREEGTNHVQWRRVGLMFTPASQRRASMKTTPITLLLFKMRRRLQRVVCVDMTARQARELGMRLCRYADRFDAEAAALIRP